MGLLRWKWEGRSGSAAAASIQQRQLAALAQVGFPGVGTSEALHRLELRLGIAFDLQRTLKQFGVAFFEPDDLALLAGGAEEAGAFHRDRQPSVGDDLLA